MVCPLLRRRQQCRTTNHNKQHPNRSKRLLAPPRRHQEPRVVSHTAGTAQLPARPQELQPLVQIPTPHTEGTNNTNNTVLIYSPLLTVDASYYAQQSPPSGASGSPPPPSHDNGYPQPANIISPPPPPGASSYGQYANMPPPPGQ
jgi:hypothetical protein